MIDYVKISVKKIDTTILENNPLLKFFSDGINLETGEIKTTNKYGQKITLCKKAHYKNLDFIIYSTNTVHISGSLHKFYNDGLHNYNIFDFNAFLAVLSDLKLNFGIEPENCIIKNLEIGLNVIPPIKTSLLLNYCFLHKTNLIVNSINNSEGNYKQCELTQYTVKMYDKALQYKKRFPQINSEIFRFELKFNKMERIKKLGVFTLDDIIKSGFKIFENDLITEWNNILFFDNTIQTKSKRLLNYKNPIYWTNLLRAKSKSNYYKQREILKDFTIQNSNQIQLQITELMKLKIDEIDKGA